MSYEFDWSRKIFANCLKAARQYTCSNLGLLRKISSNTGFFSLLSPFKPLLSVRFFKIFFSEIFGQPALADIFANMFISKAKKLYVILKALRSVFLIFIILISRDNDINIYLRHHNIIHSDTPSCNFTKK